MFGTFFLFAGYGVWRCTGVGGKTENINGNRSFSTVNEQSADIFVVFKSIFL